MSLINEYRATEEAIKELQERLAVLNSDERLKKEIEFESQLRSLMSEHGKSLRDIILIIDPAAGRKATAATPAGKRRERTVKVYRNPNDGEEIRTKGGNNKRLKEWKEQYSAETVEGWLVK